MTAFSDETGELLAETKRIIACGVTDFPVYQAIALLEKFEAALLASPVAQEPVADTTRARMHADRIRWLLKNDPDGLAFALEMHREARSIMETLDELIATPPATPAGVGAEKLRELASCLDRALGDTDPSINPDYTDDEIKRDYPVFWVCQQLNAILALLSRDKS